MFALSPGETCFTDAALVAGNINYKGNTIARLGDSGNTLGTFKAVTEPNFEKVKKTITPEQLDEVQGKLVLFWVKPTDAALLPFMSPVKWAGDTYYLQPAQLTQNNDESSMVVFLGSTGGAWIMTDVCAVFRDNGTFVGYTSNGRPVAAPPNIAQYTGTITIEGTTLPVSPELTVCPVACKYGFTNNVDDPTGVGRITRFRLDTADHLYFVVDNAFIHDSPLVNNFDWVVNLCTQQVGNQRFPVPGWGTVSRVMGDAFLRISPVSNTSQIIEYSIVTENNPPSNIKAFLQDVIDAGYAPPTVAP